MHIQITMTLFLFISSLFMGQVQAADVRAIDDTGIEVSAAIKVYLDEQMLNLVNYMFETAPTTPEASTNAIDIKTALTEASSIKYLRENQWISTGLYQTNIDEDPHELLFNSHAVFCSPNSAQELAPTQQGGFECSPDQTQAMEFGDLKPSSILRPLRYTDELELAAAEAAIKNLFEPFPGETLKDTVGNEAEAARGGFKRKVASGLAAQAPMALSRYAVLEMWANRQPTSASDNRSVLEIMEQEATRRFLGTDDWYSKMEDASPEAVQREIANMLAFLMYMEYQNYRQNELIALLNSNATALSGRMLGSLGTVSTSVPR